MGFLDIGMLSPRGNWGKTKAIMRQAVTNDSIGMEQETGIVSASSRLKGQDLVIKRMFGASVRAILVASVFAMPAIMLPGTSADAIQMVVLLSMIAALLVFVEYSSEYPSLIEFRDAPPFNRIRFVAFFSTVLLLTLIARGATVPTSTNGMLHNLGHLIGNAMDFPFSPVRLMVLLAPDTASLAEIDQIRIHAGFAYLISLAMLLIFVTLVRVMDWPLGHGAFNFWINLPLFDPTAGGDVLRRLKRDSHVNVALGFLLPFLIPAILKVASVYAISPTLTDPQTLIWTMSAWAFLPVSLIMRGVALMRIADLIEEKRRRAYAQAELQVV